MMCVARRYIDLPNWAPACAGVAESFKMVDMPDTALPERLARAITLAGPIPVAQYMAAANAR